jgi:hypothetical protein
MPLIHFCGILLLVTFLVLVTVGEDLVAVLVRINDAFHPLDQELRAVVARARAIR